MQFLITNPTKKKKKKEPPKQVTSLIWLVFMEDDSLILFSLQVMQKLEKYIFLGKKKYFKGMINIKLNQLKTIF